ncbi:bifunctional DNA-formamidopyrimidine glycosylase/DNA-(apurinic or apyrimidinic site) lyase [Jatrophihabitans sp. YIM 134969]
MPELPEVETVRAGLAHRVPGRTITGVEVHHPRSVRRHLAGADDFAARLLGRTVTDVRRRGKFLWLPLSPGDSALVGHLGMSGQLLVNDAAAPDPKHLHVRLRFADGDPEVRFVDQRTFGGMLADDLVPTPDLPGDTVPASVAHIARDPLDPAFDDAAFSRRLRAGRREVKAALLDQNLVSGVGNIYADESLWRVKLSGRRRSDTLSAAHVRALLAAVREVLGEALAAGGTSFDALYVDADGRSGYFARELAVYGREGEPCPRCGTAVVRSSFANRSSFTCPRCQRPPRA